MTGTQVVTIYMQKALAFIAVPLFLIIVQGKVFGHNPPQWSIWAMLALILAFWVWWVRDLIGTIRTIREVRRQEEAARR